MDSPEKVDTEILPIPRNRSYPWIKVQHIHV